MVTNGNWASINTNTNTNLPSSVLAASLFYYLVEYPLFLMTAVASISPGFRTISRKFPDPNSGDLLAQILLTAPLVTPRCFSSMTNSLQHHGNPVPSLKWVESFSGHFQKKIGRFLKVTFFLNRDISGVRGHWAEMEHVLECSLRTQSGLTIQFSIN